MSEEAPPEPENLHVPGLTEAERAALQSGGDGKAADEAKYFAAGASEEDWEKEARKNEHGRTERFRDHFEGLAKRGLTLAFWAAVIFGGVWAWHLIMPTCLRWLSEEELSHLQNLIAGGVLATLAAEHFRRRMG